MQKIKYLIIGGGISGLSFANAIKKDYLIIEKEENLGGLCRTHYVSDYVWDYAGHFFHFANSKMKVYFEKNLAEKNIVACKKNTKIFYKASYIDYPFQKNIHQLEKEEFIECLYDLYFKCEKKNYSDFLDMLYGKFGKGITDKFLKPYNEKLYACDLAELDTEAMGRFFPYADIKDIIKNMNEEHNTSYNEYFEYPKRGAQVIIDILKKNIPETSVFLKTSVWKIDIGKKIVYTTEGKVQYDYLINTIPFKQFIQLYNSKMDSRILSANKVLVFNLGFDKKTEIEQYHWIYFPSEKQIFYRVGFYDNILSADKGSMYVEIGYSEKESLSEEKIQEALKRTLKNLEECGIITNQKLMAYEYLIINPGYVHISNESNKAVKKENQFLTENNIYSVGRYGKWTYCSMEDCILQAQKLAEELGGNK